MSIAILALAIMAYDPSISEVTADRISTACFVYGNKYHIDPFSVAAVWRVESTWRLHPPHSHAGACGPLQVLGGRYGHPGCDEILWDYRIGVDSGVKAIRYFRIHCSDRWPDCFNRGWGGKTHGTYGRRVRKVRARLLSLIKEVPQ